MATNKRVQATTGALNHVGHMLYRTYDAAKLSIGEHGAVPTSTNGVPLATIRPTIAPLERTVIDMDGKFLFKSMSKEVSRPREAAREWCTQTALANASEFRTDRKDINTRKALVPLPKRL
jgi:hypothetical protein